MTRAIAWPPWRGRVRGMLARRAPCPLVIVPAGARPGGGRVVVCGVRDCADAGTADVARRLALSLGLPLTLVHVLPAAHEAPPPAGVLERPWDEETALRLLEDVAAAAGAVAALRVAEGPADRVLAAVAAREEAALLVVGS